MHLEDPRANADDPKAHALHNQEVCRRPAKGRITWSGEELQRLKAVGKREVARPAADAELDSHGIGVASCRLRRGVSWRQLDDDVRASRRERGARHRAGGVRHRGQAPGPAPQARAGWRTRWAATVD